MQKRFLIVVAGGLLSACVSTSSVLEVGKDTYTVSATADGFRDASSARESAYKSGQEKCASLNKRFSLINEDSRATRMGIDTTVTVSFRCISSDDADYQRPIIRKAPDLVIEKR